LYPNYFTIPFLSAVFIKGDKAIC